MNNPVIEIRLCYISYSCIILLHRLCIAPKYHVTLKVLVDRVDIIRLCKVNVFSCDWGTKQLLDRQQGWFLSHNVCISLDPFSFPLTNAAMFPHVSKSNPKLTNWPTQRQQQQNPPHAHHYQQQRCLCSSLPSDPRMMHPAFTTGFQWQPSAPVQQQQPVLFDASKYSPVFYGYQSPVVSSKSRL